jgi:hypothetical protein
LKQNALDNFIEIIGILEIQDEVCADTAILILAKFNEESLVKKNVRIQLSGSKKSRKLVVEVNTPQSSTNIISCSKNKNQEESYFMINGETSQYT